MMERAAQESVEFVLQRVRRSREEEEDNRATAADDIFWFNWIEREEK
jgi:hypothetical protein